MGADTVMSGITIQVRLPPVRNSLQLCRFTIAHHFATPSCLTNQKGNPAILWNSRNMLRRQCDIYADLSIVSQLHWNSQYMDSSATPGGVENNQWAKTRPKWSASRTSGDESNASYPARCLRIRTFPRAHSHDPTILFCRLYVAGRPLVFIAPC